VVGVTFHLEASIFLCGSRLRKEVHTIGGAEEVIAGSLGVELVLIGAEHGDLIPRDLALRGNSEDPFIF
jgi:hypothetical protein